MLYPTPSAVPLHDVTVPILFGYSLMKMVEYAVIDIDDPIPSTILVRNMN